MQLPSLNWKRGFIRIYIVGSVLFLGFGIYHGVSNGLRKDYVYDCEDYRVTNLDRCKTDLELWAKEKNECIEKSKSLDLSLRCEKSWLGHRVKKTTDEMWRTIWYRFDNYLYPWIGFSIGIIILVWIIRGFLKKNIS